MNTILEKKIDEFQCQIPFYYKNHSIINQHQFTSLIITKYFFNSHHVKGYDINGIIRYWSINNFNKTLRTTITKFFKLHKTDKNIQFLIYWKNLPVNPPRNYLIQNSKLYGKKVKYKSVCRYLGAQLYDSDPHCIVSDSKTCKHFIKRMFTKEHQLLHSLQLKYSQIHLNIKLPLNKTFVLAYTEIFAQILPNYNLKVLDEISFNSQIKLCQIFHKKVQQDQFRVFIVLPPPSQRWITLKLLHYYEAIHNPNHNVYNQLINYNLNDDLPTFNQLRKIIQTWTPSYTKYKILNDKNITITKYRGSIIKAFSKYNISKLNIFHPFKRIKFITSKYIPFYITDIDKIRKNYPKIKKKHLNQYYELFYNFGWFDRKSKHEKFCKLCKIRHKHSTAQHVICDCSSIQSLRNHFWIDAHNNLVTLYNKINSTHQKLFGFHVLQTLENLYANSRFWDLNCGMNMYSSEKNNFYYNPNVKSHRNSHLDFLNTLIGYLATRVSICKDTYKDPHKIKFKEKFVKKHFINYNYM